MHHDVTAALAALQRAVSRLQEALKAQEDAQDSDSWRGAEKARLLALLPQSGACEDPEKGFMWFRPADLAKAAGYANAGPVVRLLSEHVVVCSEKLRKHPVTGEVFPRRERWAALRWPATLDA